MEVGSFLFTFPWGEGLRHTMNESTSRFTWTSLGRAPQRRTWPPSPPAAPPRAWIASAASCAARPLGCPSDISLGRKAVKSMQVLMLDELRKGVKQARR